MRRDADMVTLHSTRRPSLEAASNRPVRPHTDGERSQCRWIHPEKQRYYSVALVRDLFGDWTLLQCWGGIGSQLGGQRIVLVESHEAGLKQIAAIGKRRLQHGYRETVA
ncbi:WGR domain-containing protein [Allochromatium vinosum]|nr:WGR domain-containing protein [Allochromatium vinosum]